MSLELTTASDLQLSGIRQTLRTVGLIGDEAISGIKTFNKRPFVNGSGILLSGDDLSFPNQILNTTYSNLTGLKATSGLLSGQLYRISDFVLKWRNQSVNDQTTKTAASGEPLIVTALSNKQISHIAQSEIYPQDTIYYNIDASGSYSWGYINNNAAIPDFKGWIYRRIDNLLNIDIPYDWRNITVNCCKPDVSSVPNYSGNYQYTRLDYVKETGNNSNRGKLYYSVVTGNSGNALSNSNFWNPVSAFVESGTYFATDENSNAFVGLYDEFNLGDFKIQLPPITSSRIQQPTFTSIITGLGTFSLVNVNNIKIEGGHSNVIVGVNFNNNIIKNNFYENTIGASFMSNIIGDNFNYSTIGDNFSYNTIGDNFTFNNTSNNFSYNNFAQSTSNNTIAASFQVNVIGTNFNFNFIEGNFSNNTIGNAFYGNSIGGNFNYNSIKNAFFYNDIRVGAVYNVIGNSFSYNTIGNNFASNTIGNDINYNTIGNSANSNTIGSHFSDNTIGNLFEVNTIGNFFYSNTIGNSFFGNTAEGEFNEVDFSTATHVYNSYNTTLFTNSAFSLRLRYFNSSDQLVVTDPTA